MVCLGQCKTSRSQRCFVSKLSIIKLEWWLCRAGAAAGVTCEEIPRVQWQRSSSKTVGTGAAKSLQPHRLQHARIPCPLLSPGVCSDSHPLSWLYYLTTSPSAALFFFAFFPSVRVFSNESTLLIRWPRYWSFNFSISASDEYSGLISFRINWFDLLQSKGLSRVFSNTTVQKHQFFGAQPSSHSNSHIHT